MKNGQLKAAYNVQSAVENYFIVQAYVSNDRTDYNLSLIHISGKNRIYFPQTGVVKISIDAQLLYE